MSAPASFKIPYGAGSASISDASTVEDVKDILRVIMADLAVMKAEYAALKAKYDAHTHCGDDGTSQYYTSGPHTDAADITPDPAGTASALATAAALTITE